jgi:hypothetical protein
MFSTWDIEHTDEFEAWWLSCTDDERESIRASVERLSAFGPALGFPYSSDVRGSRFGQMRELRVQHEGRPYRVFYAFNPLRTVLLLIGGEKTGDARFYKRMVSVADDLYAEHLSELRREGRIK